MGGWGPGLVWQDFSLTLMESLGDVSKVKYKPKKRIDLKKLEPKSSEENLEPESVEISTSSDDDKRFFQEKKSWWKKDWASIFKTNEE